MQVTFADGIANITLTGQLIRIDFGTVTAAQNAEGKQELRLSPSQQMVMPLEGFVRAFTLQEQIMKKLISDGVLKVQPPANVEDVVTAQ